MTRTDWEHRREEFEDWLKENPAATYREACKMGYQKVFRRFYRGSLNFAKESLGIGEHRHSPGKSLYMGDNFWAERFSEMMEYAFDHPDTKNEVFRNNPRHIIVFQKLDSCFPSPEYGFRMESADIIELAGMGHESKEQRAFENSMLDAGDMDQYGEGPDCPMAREELWKNALGSLNEKEMDILMRSVVDGESLESISRSYGRSIQAMSLRRQRALKKLRHPKRMAFIMEIAKEL